MAGKGKPIVHIEIPASNGAVAAKFYGDAFGWELSHDDSFDYWQFEPSAQPGGGFVNVSDGTNADMGSAKVGDLRIYIASDDIEADLARIESLGGARAGDPMEIPGVGWFATFTDPTGNTLALYKANHPPA
jgi:predicted enzyme related to lactoylglutathione lyase